MKFGLPNLGYTCYINTTLQCLFHCKYFTRFLKELNSSDITKLSNLYEVFSNANSSNKDKHDSYITFLKSLQKNIPSIDINHENDIHEFIVLFIDLYFETFKRVVKIDKPTTLTSLDKVLKYNCDALWFNHYSEICDIMFSQQIIKTRCNSCGFILHNYESSSVLSVDILLNSLNSVQKGLDKHFSSTTIEEYKCDKCNLSNTTQKKSFIVRTPRLLLICLKRFSYENNKIIKHNKGIQIDKYLDLSKFFYFHPPTQSSQYSLKSIALHHGDALNGHYTSMLFDSDETTFIDDMNVIYTKNKDVNIESSAYLMMYELIC